MEIQDIELLIGEDQEVVQFLDELATEMGQEQMNHGLAGDQHTPMDSTQGRRRGWGVVKRRSN